MHAKRFVQDLAKSKTGHYHRRLLELGDSFRGRAKCSLYPAMARYIAAESPRPRECYCNALRFALLYDQEPYEYHEGFWMWHLGLYPVHHAWLVNTDTQKIVDPTAEACDAEFAAQFGVSLAPSRDTYFGLHVPTWYLRERVFKKKEWGIVSADYVLHLDEEAA